MNYWFRVTIGRKRVQFRGAEPGAVYVHESSWILENHTLKIPKMRQFLALAAKVVEQGESLIIFDLSVDYLVVLWQLLDHHGIKTYLFTPAYSPGRRAQLLEQFKAEKGAVLLGSIAMLSEGHNITEANHIAFLRYPRDPEKFRQALGRVHRYPQKKIVYVHFIVSCALEEYLAFKGIADGYSKVQHCEIEDMLREFE